MCGANAGKWLDPVSAVMPNSKFEQIRRNLHDPAGILTDQTKGNSAVTAGSSRGDFLNIGTNKRLNQQRWAAYYAKQQQFDLQRQRDLENPRSLLA